MHSALDKNNELYLFTSEPYTKEKYTQEQYFRLIKSLCNKRIPIRLRSKLGLREKTHDNKIQ
jgi:hypothetical protein